jgi:hypothetical protein
METSWPYDVLTIAKAAIFFAGGAALALVGAKRIPSFFPWRYLKWLSVAIAWAAVSPFIYIWVSPQEVAYPDAALLHVHFVGWSHVVAAYSALAGVIAGGVGGGLFNMVAPGRRHDG